MSQVYYRDMLEVVDYLPYVLFTGNAIVKSNGALVMGAGFARAMRDRYPGLDYRIGQSIAAIHGDYGVAWAGRFGAFQVKRHFKDSADLDLIRYSVNELTRFASRRPHSIFAMNFPGIGNGKLRYDDVRPLLEPLPANVWIYSL